MRAANGHPCGGRWLFQPPYVWTSNVQNAVETTAALPANTPPSKQERWKAFWVDVFVMNTFSYVIAAPLELWIAGMNWQAHLQARLIALPINSLIGRPYGLWREFLIRRTGMTEHSSAFKRYWVDTLVFLSFQLPVYVGILALSGADWYGIMKAAGIACLLAGLVGRPYGVYLDFVRKLVGLKPMTANPT